MQCSKCGFENPPEAKFCGKCGEILRGPGPLPPPPPPTEEVPQGLKIGILVGSFFIPLLGIIMGAIYMNDPSPEKKKVGKLWLLAGIGLTALYCICVFASGFLGALGNTGGY
jgi:hypothetical protein